MTPLGRAVAAGLAAAAAVAIAYAGGPWLAVLVSVLSAGLFAAEDRNG